MACFREKPDSLNTFIMTTPSVQPFFRDEAIVLLLPQIARGVNKAFTCSRVHVLSVTVVDRCCSVDFVLTSIIFCSLLESRLPLSFELFNDVLLLSAKVCCLCFELFHTLINRPRSFEITGCHLALSLPFFLKLSPLLFSWFIFLWFLITYVKSCSPIGGVLSEAPTLKTVVLIHKLASVYMLRL